MPNLTRQVRGWGRKKPPPGSEIDGSHRLARGLVGAYLLNEGGGLAAYDSTNRNPPGTLTGGPTWARGPDTAVLSFDGTDDYVSIPHSAALMPSAALTVAMRVKALSPIGNFDFAVGKLGSESWNDGYGIYWGPTVNDVTGFVSTYSNTFGRFTGMTPTNWNTLVLRYDGGSVQLWVNGIKGATETAYTGAIAANTGTLNVSRAYAGFYTDQLVDYLYVWNRPLHPGEIGELNDRPYDFILTPPPRRLFGQPPLPPVDKTGADTLTLAQGASSTAGGTGSQPVPLTDAAQILSASTVTSDTLALGDAATADIPVLFSGSDALMLAESAAAFAGGSGADTLTLAEAAGVTGKDLAAAEAFSLAEAAAISGREAIGAQGLTFSEAAAVLMVTGEVTVKTYAEFGVRRVRH